MNNYGATNFIEWVRQSRMWEGREPQRYLKFYEGKVQCTERLAIMTQETLELIERNCGRYDGTFPTGTYLGKMFLRGNRLFWIGINKKDALNSFTWNSRRVVIDPS